MREITCIRCPVGCLLTVQIEDDQVVAVTGNQCMRGPEYARQEVINPTRTITTLMPIEGSAVPLSVKTEESVPHDKMDEVVRAIHEAHVNLPVSIGDIVLENVCNTGVNVVATRNLQNR